MKSVLIRAARPDDSPGIARVHVASWRATYPGIVPDCYLEAMSHDEYESFWFRSLSEEPGGRIFYVAEDSNGTVIGFSSGGPGREPPHEGLDCELYTVYLAPGHVGGGVGSRLFRAVASGLAAAGRKSMYCWVMAENHVARRFYERLGGRKFDEHIFVVDEKEIVEVSYEWEDLKTLANVA